MISKLHNTCVPVQNRQKKGCSTIGTYATRYDEITHGMMIPSILNISVQCFYLEHKMNCSGYCNEDDMMMKKTIIRLK